MMEFNRSEIRMVPRTYPVTAFLRPQGMKRGEEETFEAYKTSRKAHNRAQKLIKKHGASLSITVMIPTKRIPQPEVTPEWIENLEELDETD